MYLRAAGSRRPHKLYHSPFSTYFNIYSIFFVGILACKLYEKIRREAAAKKIQKNIRRYEARKAYKKLHVSALILQTALRAIAARKEFRLRKQTKASIIIQVLVKSYIDLDHLLGSLVFNILNSFSQKICRLGGSATKLRYIIGG